MKLVLPELNCLFRQPQCGWNLQKIFGCGVLLVCLLCGCVHHRDVQKVEGNELEKRPGWNQAVTNVAGEHSLAAYDAKMIWAVQERWYSLISNYKIRRSGKAVVEFRLYPDGKVSDFRVIKNELGKSMGEFCQRAVLDLAPFDPVPNELLKAYEKGFRELRFTFQGLE